MSAEKIYEQLKSQMQFNPVAAETLKTGAAGTAEGGLGSVDAVLRDMASRLSAAGLTSIEDFGRRKFVSFTQDKDRFGKPIPGAWRFDSRFNQTRIPAEAINALQPYFAGKSGSASISLDELLFATEQAWSPSIVSFIDQAEQSAVDKYFNKKTGNEIKEFGGIDGGWGRNTAGDGQTIYAVKFDDNTGLPIFFNLQTHGKQKYEDFLKIATIAATIFAPQIGAAIAPSAPAIAQAAIGAAIAGFVGSGGDLERGLKVGIASFVGAKVGSWAASTTSAPYVGTVVNNMTRAAILGESMDKALVSSLTQVAPDIVRQYVPNFASLPRAAQEAAIAATVDLMRTGGDNLDQIAKQGVASGATDYALGQIDGYNNLRTGQKEVIRQQVSQALIGKDLGKAALDAAIGLGNEAVRYTVDTEQAQKEGWQNLEQKQGAQQLYGLKVTPSEFSNRQTTTEQEAKDFAQQILGRPATEFELLELIGLPESNAKSLLQTNAQTFDAFELTQAYKDVYGKEPPSGWLESAEAKAMLGSTEAQGKAQLQNYFTEDKNTTNRTEAEAFWKEMGNTGPIPEDALFNMLAGPEKSARATAETYKIVNDDIKATTFDGSKFNTKEEAQAAAIKAGYNTFNWGDNSYTLMSQQQAEQLQRDIAAGKNVGVRPDAFFYPQPGKTLEQQLQEAGNPDEYAYMQGDTIHVVSKRLDVPDFQDIEAWQAFKKEKQDLGGDNFKTFLTEQFSLLEQAMKGAPPDSIKSILANAALFGYGKMAQLVETFSRTGEAAGIPKSQSLTNIAKQVQSWTGKLQSQGIQNAEAAVMANVAAVTKESIAAQKGVRPSDISNTEWYLQKSLALIRQVKDNPLGASLFIGGEAIQEIPLLVASGGIGSVFKTLIGKSVGLSAAVGTNVALNGAESFGGNYGEVKDYLRKQGLSEAQADAAAVRSGLEAMGVSMLTAYVGDRALIRSFMGDLAKDSFGKVIATNGAREWALGNFEGFMQNASAQVGKYGEFKSMDEALNAGIMEGFAQKGIATGVLSADALSRVVAKDYDGKNVTLGDIIDGKSTFNPATVNKNLDFGSNVKLGDAFDYQSAFQHNPNITPDEYFFTAQTFRQNGMSEFTPDEIASIVGGASNLTKQDITKLASTFAQDSVVTVDEAKQMMRDLGYTNMTDQEAMSLAGKIRKQDALTNVQKYVGEKTITRAEAEQFFKDIGYTPTEAEINQFVRQGADVSEAGVRKEIGEYMASRQELEDRLSGAISDAIAKGLEGDKALQSAIDKVAADVGGTKADLLAKLGATETSLKSQFATQISGLDTKLTAAINDAKASGLAGDAALKAAIDKVAKDQNTTAENLLAKIGTTETALKAQFASQISDIKTELAQTEKDILAEVAKNEQAGMTRDAALQKAINDVAAAQKTDAATLLSRIGTTEANLKNQISTQVASLDAKLSKAIADARAAGLSGDAALKSAIDQVAADQKVSSTNLLSQLGKTEAALKTQFSAELAGVKTQLSDLEKSLSDEIQAAIDIGLAGDQALQAGLNSLAAKLGTNQTALLSQLGKTEAALKTQFSTQLTSLDAKLSKAIADARAAGLAGDAALQSAIAKVASDLGTTKSSVLSQLGKTESALRAEMEAKFAGVSQQYNALSAAQKATADALVAQGKSMQEAIAAAQAQTAGQIAGVETRLTEAIAAAEAMGLSRDQAITAAVDSVAAELGITKTNLLSQIGKTEATLRAELTSGLAGLSAETKAQYNALTAEQKALANQLAQQGVDLKTAIAQVQQQTAGQIAGLTADVQAKYNALTAEQKALANQLAQQGVDLTTAINTVASQITADVQAKYNALDASQKALANQLNQQGVDLRTAIDVAAQQTQQQVLDLGTQLNTRVDQLMKQGMDQYAATQQAIAEVNQQNQQLQGLVGTQGRTATQQDIDTLNQMLSGQREVDLAYDVTGDRQVTQADIDFLTRVVGGQEWTAPAGSVWAPTGLYGQIAAAEAQRQADLAEQARQAQEAEKRAATRTLASQAQTQLQSVMGQLPAAYQALQTTTTPIYAGEMAPFDLGSPLDVDFFSPSKEKQGSQTGQQPTKIATGGYLDDLLDLLR